MSSCPVCLSWMSMGVVKLNVWGWQHCITLVQTSFGLKCPHYIANQKVFPGQFHLQISPSKVNWQTYKKTLRRVLFNALVTNTVFQLTVYPLMVWRGMPCGYELPSFGRVIWDAFICLVVVEIGFYYSHRYAMKERLDGVRAEMEWCVGRDGVMVWGWRWGDSVWR